VSPRDRPRLAPAAQFTDRSLADEAWTALIEEGVPATLEHTPRSFGQGGYTRVYVPEDDLERAQELLTSIVARDRTT
jgi:hypothetical protein